MANIVLRFDGRYLEMREHTRQHWWPALLVWLEQFYYGKCVGLPLKTGGYHYKTLDLAAAMFEDVRELSEQRYWPCIKQELEEKHRTARAAYYEALGFPPPSRTPST